MLVHVLVGRREAGDALALGRDLAGRLAAAGAPPERRADLLVGLARAAPAAGDLTSGEPPSDEALRAAGPDADRAVLARIDAVAADVALDTGRARRPPSS